MKKSEKSFYADYAKREAHYGLNSTSHFEQKYHDDGAGGKLAEAVMKILLCNTRGKRAITPEGRVDTRKDGLKVEIKTGFGEVYSYDEHGTPCGSILRADVVVWFDFRGGQKAREGLVFWAEDFLALPIFRDAYSTAQYREQGLGSGVPCPAGWKSKAAYMREALGITPCQRNFKGAAMEATMRRVLNENALGTVEAFFDLG